MKRLYPILALLILILAACGSAPTTQTPMPTPTPTDTPTPDANAGGPAPSATVAGACGSKCGTSSSSTGSSFGQSVESGTWLVTINSTKTSMGSQYDTPPKAGDIYLTINFTVKNMSANAQETSSYPFTLRDSQGTTYNDTYLDGTAVNYGTVQAGQQLRGDLSYEVPTATHSFILQFDDPMDFDHSQIVQWTITD